MIAGLACYFLLYPSAFILFRAAAWEWECKIPEQVSQLACDCVLVRKIKTEGFARQRAKLFYMYRPSIEETLKKPHYGRCRVCGRNGRFTKEHVPPKSSGNKGVVIVSTPKTIASPNRVSMRPEYEISGGIFIYSLCDRCNNKTGTRYGADYSRFVEVVRPSASPENAIKTVPINAAGIHPLRIIKQATSMLLSTSNPTDFSGHEFVATPGKSKRDLAGIEINVPSIERQREAYAELRLFVRQRDSNVFPSGVRIYMFASVGKLVGFRTGIFSQVNLADRSVVFAAATGLHPVHWIFTFDSEPHKEMLDVTDWTTRNYKESFTQDVQVPMKWLEGHYPTDFRSPQDLTTYNFIHSMELEGFIPLTINDSEKLLEEALFFARTLGKRTHEGYLISTFSTGTFYEYSDFNGWLPDGNGNDGIKVLEFRLKSANRTTHK